MTICTWHILSQLQSHSRCFNKLRFFRTAVHRKQILLLPKYAEKHIMFTLYIEYCTEVSSKSKKTNLTSCNSYSLSCELNSSKRKIRLNSDFHEVTLLSKPKNPKITSLTNTILRSASIMRAKIRTVTSLKRTNGRWRLTVIQPMVLLSADQN